MSILNEAHTLSEDDIRNHLNQCKLKDGIRVTHTYHNYFRGIYLSINRETVQVAVTQIISHFHSNSINLIWCIYKNYRAFSERRIKDIGTEISNIEINKTPEYNIVVFKNNVKSLWQLCIQYRNPITDLH